MPIYDVIIVGAGTVGAATAMELARRGISVLGLDAHHPPHRLASHHGESRSIRRAYLEGTVYVPLARHAWEGWRRLEKDTGVRLLSETGNLTIGPDGAPAIAGFLASARRYDIPHEVLSAADVRRRWPILTPPDEFVAGLELEAGVLAPERALTVMLREAAVAGASLHFDEGVHDWRPDGDGLEVRTSRGRYTAGRVLLSAGAGAKRLLGDAGHALMPRRVPVHWVRPPQAAPCELGRLPVNFWQLPVTGENDYHEIYTLPITRSGGRVKAAAHNRLEDCDPSSVIRTATADEVNVIRRFLARHLPSLAKGDIRSDVCLYTLTPDGDFILGPLPGTPNVFTAALAGHGFKFAPALGEILADMLEEKSPAFDVTSFLPDRLT